MGRVWASPKGEGFGRSWVGNDGIGRNFVSETPVTQPDRGVETVVRCIALEFRDRVGEPEGENEELGILAGRWSFSPRPSCDHQSGPLSCTGPESRRRLWQGTQKLEESLQSGCPERQGEALEEG